MDIIHSTEESFELDVIQSSIPVLVDFWAEWCGPCRMIAPILEEIAKEFSGKIKVVKVNVDEAEHTAAQYEIRGIPALLLFNNGQIVANKVGFVSKPQLVEFINQNIYF